EDVGVKDVGERHRHAGVVGVHQDRTVLLAGGQAGAGRHVLVQGVTAIQHESDRAGHAVGGEVDPAGQAGGRGAVTLFGRGPALLQGEGDTRDVGAVEVLV